MTAEEQEAEHRQVFPDRKCELAGSFCKGIVIVTTGDHQLCTAHVTVFEDYDHAGRAARAEAWIRNRRVMEAKLQAAQGAAAAGGM